MDGLWGRVQAEVEAREGRCGLSPYDLLELPRAERTLLRRLLKEKMITLADAATQLAQSEEDALHTLDVLVEKTYLIEFEKKGQRCYKILLARKEGKDLPFNIWDDLSDKLGG